MSKTQIFLATINDDVLKTLNRFSLAELKLAEYAKTYAEERKDLSEDKKALEIQVYDSPEISAEDLAQAEEKLTDVNRQLRVLKFNNDLNTKPWKKVEETCYKELRFAEIYNAYCEYVATLEPEKLNNALYNLVENFGCVTKGDKTAANMKFVAKIKQAAFGVRSTATAKYTAKTRVTNNSKQTFCRNFCNIILTLLAQNKAFVLNEDGTVSKVAEEVKENA